MTIYQQNFIVVSKCFIFIIINQQEGKQKYLLFFFCWHKQFWDVVCRWSLTQLSIFEAQLEHLLQEQNKSAHFWNF